MMLSFARKALTLGMAGFLGAAMLAGAPASARTLDEILADKTIRVGVNPTLPPLGVYDDTNSIAGFDVDFATKIAEMLGVELEIVQLGGPDRIPFVASGKVDFVMGAMTRTPERAKVIDFTAPVHTEVLGVLTTDKNAFGDWKEFNTPDVTFVEVRGSTPVQFLKENLPEAKVLLLDNYPDVIRALAQGRGDAMLDVIDFVGEHMNKYDTAWRVVETPVDVYYCALGVAKGNDSLRNWLNVAIFELHRDGVVDDLWVKWFGRPMIQKVNVSPYF